MKHILDSPPSSLLNLRLYLFLQLPDDLSFAEFLAYDPHARQVFVVFGCSDEVQRILLLALTVQIFLMLKCF